jgi:hypothetical protein
MHITRQYISRTPSDRSRKSHISALRLVQGDTFGTCVIRHFMVSTSTARVCAYRHLLCRINIVGRIIAMYLYYYQCGVKQNYNPHILESWPQYFYTSLNFTLSIPCGKYKMGERVKMFLFFRRLLLHKNLNNCLCFNIRYRVIKNTCHRLVRSK